MAARCAAGARWRRSATVGGGTAAVGAALAALAAGQALDAEEQWKHHYRLKTSACLGPTDGLEGRCGRYLASARQHGPSAAPGASRAPAGRAPPVLLLFLGDSLVSGVGGQEADAEAAPAALPRAVAASLAERTGGRVTWASVGITGAHAELLAEEGLPQLREKATAHADPDTVVVVVLVVGANDLKKFDLQGFRRDLRGLVGELRHLACNGRPVDAVLLPALRVTDAPMLGQFPLRCFVRPICALWEREKRQVAAHFKEVEVLPFPALPGGALSTAGAAALFSPDRMHPSDSGYRWWAESLAGQIHRVLQSRCGAAAERAERADEAGEDWAAPHWQLACA